MLGPPSRRHLRRGVGDGGGVYIDLSAAFFRKVTGLPDLRLGRFCVGNFFPAFRSGWRIPRRTVDRIDDDRPRVRHPRGPRRTRRRQRAAPRRSRLPTTDPPMGLRRPEVCPEPAGLDLLVQQTLLHIEAIGYTNPKLAGLYPLSLSARTQVLKGRLSSPRSSGTSVTSPTPTTRSHHLFPHAVLDQHRPAPDDGPAVPVPPHTTASSTPTRRTASPR